MKAALYIIGISLVLTGCDDSFDALNAVNSAPEISFSPDKAVEQFSDSVKVSPKVGTLQYSGHLYFHDKEDGVNALQFIFTKKEGEFYVEGEKLEEGVPYITGKIDDAGYTIIPGSGLGLYQIKISIIDNLASEKQATLKLVAYDNLEPVAKLAVSKLGILSDLQYSFDASDSYDRDVARGGGIVRYLFIVNGVDLPVVDLPLINYIFPQTGGYEVRVMVQDNDGDWSGEVVQIVIVG